MLIIFEGEKSIFFAFLCGICCIEVYNLRREKCPFLSFFVLDFPKTKFTISGGGNSAPSLPSRQTGGSSGGGYRSGSTSNELVFTGALGNSNPNVKTAPQTKAGGDAINFG